MKYRVWIKLKEEKSSSHLLLQKLAEANIKFGNCGGMCNKLLLHVKEEYLNGLFGVVEANGFAIESSSPIDESDYYA